MTARLKKGDISDHRRKVLMTQISKNQAYIKKCVFDINPIMYILNLLKVAVSKPCERQHMGSARGKLQFSYL
jgi:hypothetical protein